MSGVKLVFGMVRKLDSRKKKRKIGMMDGSQGRGLELTFHLIMVMLKQMKKYCLF